MTEEHRDGVTTRYWYAECVGCHERRVVGLEGVGLWEMAIAVMGRDHGQGHVGLLIYLEGTQADERFIGEMRGLPVSIGVRDDMEMCPACLERPEVEMLPEGPFAWSMTCGCGVSRALRSRTFEQAKEIWRNCCLEVARDIADLDDSRTFEQAKEVWRNHCREVDDEPEPEVEA